MENKLIKYYIKYNIDILILFAMNGATVSALMLVSFCAVFAYDCSAHQTNVRRLTSMRTQNTPPAMVSD